MSRASSASAGRIAALLLLVAAAVFALAGAHRSGRGGARGAPRRRGARGGPRRGARALGHGGDGRAPPRRMAAILAAVARTEGVARRRDRRRGRRRALPAGEAPGRLGTVARGAPWSGSGSIVTKPVGTRPSCRGLPRRRRSERRGARRARPRERSGRASPRRRGGSGPRRRSPRSRSRRWRSWCAPRRRIQRTEPRGSARRSRPRPPRARRAPPTSQRLQAILDSMVDGVLFIDAEDRVAMVNPAGRALRNLSDGPGRPLERLPPEGLAAACSSG